MAKFSPLHYFKTYTPLLPTPTYGGSATAYVFDLKPGEGGSSGINFSAFDTDQNGIADTLFMLDFGPDVLDSSDDMILAYAKESDSVLIDITKARSDLLATLPQMPPCALTWQTTRESAVEQARNSGKLILLLAGTDSCGNCQYMKYAVLESARVSLVIDDNYVCWFCPAGSSEGLGYADGLGSYILPLICVIDPGDPTQYLDRTTSVQYEPEFESRLQNHLPAIPIAVSIQAEAGLVTIEWPSESQVNSRVQRSTDLLHWDFIGGIIAGTGEHLEMQDEQNESRSFFRIMGFR